MLMDDCLKNIDSVVTLTTDFTILFPDVFVIIVSLDGRIGPFCMFQCIDGDLLPQYRTVQDSSRALLPLKANVFSVCCGLHPGSDSAKMTRSATAHVSHRVNMTIGLPNSIFNRSDVAKFSRTSCICMSSIDHVEWKNI